MDGEELDLFRRGIDHAVERHAGEALDAALDDLGWGEALAADRRAAVSVLFERQGAAAATSSALDLVVLDALGLGLGLGGGGDVAVVLPALGDGGPPGTAVGEGVVVRGLATSGIGRRSSAVVVTGSDATVVPTGDLGLRPVIGLDPELGLVEVTGTVPAAAAPAAPWAEAVAAGRLALAHELVGSCRAMLAIARDHAVDREQFGRPIASFQAVRHRLADAYVAVEAADAALGAAWDEGSPAAATLAKAVAGRGARTVGRHCQQVLGGIGFTGEHPFHRYVRRTMVLDRLLGDARTLARSLGEDLLRTRRLPPMLPL